ncbi:unnamed protein product [Strongylus vulgaris]|uniref:Longin domain-containing protein n=1 Tax=Strongylus vulgaris TaxID=40348 RepID=A0A3P7IQ69_STRVU|nr:unnamed protein product [Strongylus vulgaris]
MKLYSILIYHKGSDSSVRSFKSAFDLSSFSFFQRGSVQEFMQFTGKLLVERSGMGARSTVKENEYYCHCYVRTDGLAAVSVTDSEYQVQFRGSCKCSHFRPCSLFLLFHNFNVIELIELEFFYSSKSNAAICLGNVGGLCFINQTFNV